MQRIYKKMAGTSAVFVIAEHPGASPVERDGLSWTETELALDHCSRLLRWKEPMDSSLALEGLEEYDPPQQGDARYVNKLQAAFVYIEKIRGWVGNHRVRLKEYDSFLKVASSKLHGVVIARH